MFEKYGVCIRSPYRSARNEGRRRTIGEPRKPRADKLAIAAALRDLERRLDLFVQALSHESAPVSAEAARTEREARRLVCEAYATIDYAPGRPGQRITGLPRS